MDEIRTRGLVVGRSNSKMFDLKAKTVPRMFCLNGQRNREKKQVNQQVYLFDIVILSNKCYHKKETDTKVQYQNAGF